MYRAIRTTWVVGLLFELAMEKWDLKTIPKLIERRRCSWCRVKIACNSCKNPLLTGLLLANAIHDKLDRSLLESRRCLMSLDGSTSVLDWKSAPRRNRRLPGLQWYRDQVVI